ncbi:PAQR family membrane homeostasis protein TrhA [[Archangium] primigenium]|uniref:PAQR family membrane homeostasis protein TrhA n=1 Tax=Melittangium TaxID=44 RepID=UPI0019583069|nr:hemolysin III family protein [Archangium primigenium]MBM7115773.1 hemolysin III family protein [Archangium primigenium]
MSSEGELSVGKAVALVKPRLRGVLHHSAAQVAFGAGVVLVALSPTPRAAWASAIYAASTVILFAVSATYHRPTWRPRERALMRRLDHACISLIIAGTYTPMCMLALPRPVGDSLLAAIWATASLGMIQALFWAHAPKWVSATVYLLVGWTIVPYFGDVRAALSSGQLALLLGGGVLYSAGAAIYALRRPNPVPAVFGYHEVFHALTLAACALHFVLVLGFVRDAGG